MKGKHFGVSFLILSIMIVIGGLPIILRRGQIRDWALVYLFNAATNVFIDKIVTKYKVVKYPVRLLPKIFKTNIAFDYFVYPFITILYNQLTYKDNLLMIIYKVFLVAFPMLLIELWAEKKTSLIKWGKGWNWYHTYFSIIIKSLITRWVIREIREMAKREDKDQKYNEKVSFAL
ncbi:MULTISPECIES: CBO0543 family protein [Bacillaceae]|nr:CBO0543 family protein [Litchfieldia alkalitelluris]